MPLTASNTQRCASIAVTSAVTAGSVSGTWTRRRMRSREAWEISVTTSSNRSGEIPAGTARFGWVR